MIKMIKMIKIIKMIKMIKTKETKETKILPSVMIGDLRPKNGWKILMSLKS